METPGVHSGSGLQVELQEISVEFARDGPRLVGLCPGYPGALQALQHILAIMQNVRPLVLVVEVVGETDGHPPQCEGRPHAEAAEVTDAGVAVLVIPVRAVQLGVVAGLQAVLVLPPIGLSLPPEGLRPGQRLSVIDIEPDVLLIPICVAAPVGELLGVHQTSLTGGAVEVVLHDDVRLRGVADPHLRVEHLAGVETLVEVGRVRLDDLTRRLRAADLLGTFLHLREAREDPDLSVPVH